MLPEKALTPGFTTDSIFKLEIDEMKIEHNTPAKLATKMIPNKVQLE